MFISCVIISFAPPSSDYKIREIESSPTLNRNAFFLEVHQRESVAGLIVLREYEKVSRQDPAGFQTDQSSS